MSKVLFLINLIAVGFAVFHQWSTGRWNQDVLGFAFGSVFWGICLLVNESTAKFHARLDHNRIRLLELELGMRKSVSSSKP